MKQGYKTTEFWLTLAVQVFGILVLLGIITPEQSTALASGLEQIIGIVVMVVAQFGYSVSRGNAKKGNNI